MKKEHLFSLPTIPQSINQSIVDYFALYGFIVKDQQENKLHFTKRCWILDALGVDPFSQCSEVIVLKKEKQIYSYARISSVTNRATSRQKAKWDQLFLNFEETLNAVIKKNGPSEVCAVTK